MSMMLSGIYAFADASATVVKLCQTRVLCAGVIHLGKVAEFGGWYGGHHEAHYSIFGLLWSLVK